MKSEQNKGYLMVLAAGSLWGTIGLFATLLSNFGVAAAPVAFFRMLSATIMLALILLVKGRGTSLFRISRRGFISCMLVGFISQAFYNICYMNTIEQGGMATAAVFLYTSPVYVAVISRLLFHEPLTRNKIIAIIINIAGCILTVTGGDFSDMRISGFGVIMGILSGFTYALLPILSKTGADDEDPFTAAFYGQALGALLLFFLIRPWNGIGTSFTLPVRRKEIFPFLHSACACRRAFALDCAFLPGQFLWSGYLVPRRGSPMNMKKSEVTETQE